MTEQASSETKLQSAQVPQILDILVTQGAMNDSEKNVVNGIIKKTLTPEQEASVELNDEQKANLKGYLDGTKKGFAGEIVVELGFADQATVDKALLDQVRTKTDAAASDISEIAAGKTFSNGGLFTSWGNNGVNPPSKPSEFSAASAVGNIAQNIALIANENPAIADDPQIQKAIKAATTLQAGFGEGGSVPENAQALTATLAEGLKHAVVETGYQTQDRRGAAVNVDEFIAARTQDIENGVALAQARQIGDTMKGVCGGAGVTDSSTITPHATSKEAGRGCP